VATADVAEAARRQTAVVNVVEAAAEANGSSYSGGKCGGGDCLW